MSYQAIVERKGGSLSSDFIAGLAVRRLSLSLSEIEALVGRFSRGPRKGLLRGSLEWAKVVKGGWVKTGAYDFDAQRGCGFIAKPGITCGYGLFNANGELVAGVEAFKQDRAGRETFWHELRAACGARAVEPARAAVPAPAVEQDDEREHVARREEMAHGLFAPRTVPAGYTYRHQFAGDDDSEAFAVGRRVAREAAFAEASA